MTDIEMINAMCNMQKKLDEALLEKGRMLGKIESFDRERTIFAFIDEIGEMVHELKGTWCWWKANQQEVDVMKVLEELVDAWHFALSLDYIQNNVVTEHELEVLSHYTISPVTCVVNAMRCASLNGSVTSYMYKLTQGLGYTMMDVYTGYCAKNKENYARIERGY